MKPIQFQQASRQPRRILRLSVDCHLSEVKAIATESVLRQLASDSADVSRLSWCATRVHRLVLALAIPPIFWFKRIRGGQCQLEFDIHGFRQTRRGRTATRTWREVADVSVFDSGVLIELHEGGAVPIPSRVLSLNQRSTLLELFHGGSQRTRPSCA